MMSTEHLRELDLIVSSDGNTSTFVSALPNSHWVWIGNEKLRQKRSRVLGHGDVDHGVRHHLRILKIVLLRLSTMRRANNREHY